MEDAESSCGGRRSIVRCSRRRVIGRSLYRCHESVEIERYIVPVEDVVGIEFGRF